MAVTTRRIDTLLRGTTRKGGPGAVWRNWWGTIVSPGETLRRVEREGLNPGCFVAYGLFPLLYSVTTAIAYLRGARPVIWRPWVGVIPEESYFLWEALFLVPLCLQLWILFAAMAHLLAKAQGGGGTFEGTMAVLAYTYSVPLVVLMWLPDVLQSLVLGIHLRGDLIAVYGTAAGIWVLLLSARGIGIVHYLSLSRSLLTAGLAIALSYIPAGLLLIR